MFGKAIDPVCGMRIRRKDAIATSQYRGKTVYFCNRACKEKFDREPEKYVGKPGK